MSVSCLLRDQIRGEVEVGAPIQSSVNIGLLVAYGKGNATFGMDLEMC